MRVVGPELRRGPESGQVGRGDEVKDLHGVARQDLVHVERSEKKIMSNSLHQIRQSIYFYLGSLIKFIISVMFQT